ncbi:MAG: insulinase family protein, partial [Bacteroidia bacterium]|nr:insulinase family protein [Bacteroidia bacterium]
MIELSFDFFQLDNGLKVYVYSDFSVRKAVFNLMYQVGARDESPERTGLAHLFEHLMFEGSVNIPHFDAEIQRV